MGDFISAIKNPKYEAEVEFFSKHGDFDFSFVVHGDSAVELVEQFITIREYEARNGRTAYLQRQVWELLWHEMDTRPAST